MSVSQITEGGKDPHASRRRKCHRGRKGNDGFLLGLAVSALSMRPGQRRTHDEIAAYVSAAGVPITRQAIQQTEQRALLKIKRKFPGNIMDYLRVE